MKVRCYYKKHDRYQNYGGRGIKVCDEWKNDFSRFKDWALKNGYDDELTIDRIDNDADYSPSNCRWITNSQQQKNRSDTLKVKINGIEKTLEQWCEIKGVKKGTVIWRKRNNWPVEKWFTEPKRNTKNIKLVTVDGETKTFTEWSEATGIPRKTIEARYYRGLRGEDVIRKGTTK